MVVFSVAPLKGGLAPSEVVLESSRAIQGVGAAIASATALSILVATFPEGPERNKALRIFAAVMSSGFASGMVAGGFITTTLSWRWGV
jgi:MFS family permease